ncbi:hypothetical protein [Bacteroides sp.]|uniref:hypothetical protein n=1 Tax=Bacteroides sp. TaxID=29523 RepID=UPI00261F6963|nr:hypothetical protein [Bacteroides sp.]MDD3040652.1 hypothetical protein [Bacteroides sp.]
MNRNLGHTTEKDREKYPSPFGSKEIWWGDIPTSPNLGDGCQFRPQISFIKIYSLGALIILLY